MLRPIRQDERSAWENELSDSRFVIHEAMTKLKNSHYVYDAIIGNVHVKYALEFNNIPSRVLMKLLRATKRVSQLSKHFSIIPLSYVIVPCAEKRRWPSNEQHVTSANINGGFTYKTGDIVYIFREEEYPKVMLHEAIHHTHLDPVPSNLVGVETLFRDTFNIATNMRFLPAEGVVEAFAVYYQCKFIADETNIPFDAIWSRELTYMREQSAAIISSSKTKPWFETTNAFAYIVVKWLCCMNMDEFVTYINKQTYQPLLPFFKHAIDTMPVSMPTDRLQYPSSMRLTIFGDL